MGEFNVAAERARRAERVNGARRVIVDDGTEYVLLAEFPLTVVDLWGEGKTEEGLDILFQGKLAEFLEKVTPHGSTADMKALGEWIGTEYGLGSPPELSASGASSPKPGKRSRPSSAGNTVSA